MRKKLPEIYLYVTTETKGEGTYYIYARVVTREGDTIKALSEPRDNLHFASWDFTVSAFGTPNDRRVRAWDVGYMDIFWVNLRELKPLVRTLTTIERGLEALNKRFGFATSFGQYLVRVANVIDATGFITPATKDLTRERHGDFRTWSLGSGVSYIDSVIEKWEKGEVTSAA